MLYYGEFDFSINPLIEKFIDRFGGNFGYDVPESVLFYVHYDKNPDGFYTPDSEKELIDLVEQSFQQNKNLLLDRFESFPELPPGAVL